MKRAAQLQPPADRGVDITIVHVDDPRRRRRIAEILLSVVDKADTPDEGRRR